MMPLDYLKMCTPIAAVVLLTTGCQLTKDWAEEMDIPGFEESFISANDAPVITFDLDYELATKNKYTPISDLPVPFFVEPNLTWCVVDPRWCGGTQFRGPYTDDDNDDHYRDQKDSEDVNQFFRSINGKGNHPQNFGMAGDENQSANVGIESALVRGSMSNSYMPDGSLPDIYKMPHPRDLSNAIFNQDSSMPSVHNLSHFTFFWGQFLDHDIVLTSSSRDFSFSITPFPTADNPPFVPDIKEIAKDGVPFARSDIIPSTGTGNLNPRQQYNLATSFIDGSQIYGSSTARSEWLRTHSGGLLKTSQGNRLPFGNPQSPFMAGLDENPALEGRPESLYVAGDIRANEVLSLLALHTLFVREHNRVAKIIDSALERADDEMIYQLARKVIGALLQSITYREFLPALGVRVPRYGGYKPDSDPRISNIFATAAFRLGHTMIAEKVELIDADSKSSDMDLFDAFFAPYLLDENSLAALFRGGAVSFSETIDGKMVSSLRNFLFGPPGSGMGLDLAMLNIQRGRDHGLPGYGHVAESIAEIEPTCESIISALYPSLDKVDLWVGILCEKRDLAEPIGPTVLKLLTQQFIVLRDGDRFFYLSDPDFRRNGILHSLGFNISYIHNRTLAKIIIDNTDIQAGKLQDNIFLVP